MRLFNKVAIVGVGLIGGSLGKAIKEKNIANEVIGVGRHKKTLVLAKKLNAIDKATQDINALKDVDLLILAAPVNAIPEIALRVRGIIKPGCVVFDVASTKEEIVSKLSRIFPNYIGTHPLAGSEKQGVINSNASIFKGSLCILTPAPDTRKNVYRKIKRLWLELGARVISLSSSAHDKIISFTSHLPHITAFSLSSVIPAKYLKFAAMGFKDTTRIAASDVNLWTGIFFSNQKNILSAIEEFEKRLSLIKSAIKKKDKEALETILAQARIKRMRL